MVVKERISQEHPAGGKTADASGEAEEQMAFYLRRAFAANAEVSVLDDLRVPLAEGDAVQIDHLLLHPFGFVLVESKSVTGSVLINEQGEWCRVSGDRRSGVRSPVIQAQMQADALRRFLNSALPPQRADASPTPRAGRFDGVPFDVLVAISDKGLIERRCPVPEVYKADVIPTRVRELITMRQAERGSPRPAFDELARKKLADFLVARHAPLCRKPEPAAKVSRPASSASPINPAPRPRPAKTQPPLPTVCRFCGSGVLHIQHGKFGYYFRCIPCTKNTPIDFTCPTCSGKARVRKDGLNFFRECRSCGTAALFYVNASLVDLEDVSDRR
jgi:hypothetical protein